MKAKAKEKKKRTKFVVAWSEYIGSERKDALGCGVFKRLYGTAKAARKMIMREIRGTAYAYINNTAEDPNAPITDEAVDELVRNGLWYKDADRVKFALADIENVFAIEEIEV